MSTTKPRPKRTIPLERRIVDLYGTYSTGEIAEMVNLNRTTIQEILRKYHVPSARGREHVAKRRYEKNPAYDRNEWFHLLYGLYWVQRLSIDKISQKTGLPVSTIHSRMQSLGIARRRRRDALKGIPRDNWSAPKGSHPCRNPACKTLVRTPDKLFCYLCTWNNSRKLRTRIKWALQQAD